MSALFCASCGGGGGGSDDPVAGTDPGAADDPVNQACAGIVGETVPLSWQSPNGVERTYILYIPCSMPKDSATKVLFAFYNYGGTVEGFINYTQLQKQADDAGFLLVLPVGTIAALGVDNSRGWNDQRGWENTLQFVDEPAFMGDGMLPGIEQFARDRGFSIDVNQLYAAGFTNGGSLSLALACGGLSDYGYELSGAAAVAISEPTFWEGNCNPKSGIKVALINGSRDPFVAWCTEAEKAAGIADCELTEGSGSQPTSGDFNSVYRTRTLWEQRLSCSLDDVDFSDNDSTDGTTLTAYNHSCTGGELNFFRINGGGHTWPGGDPAFSPGLVNSTELDASKTIVEVFGL